MVGAGVLLRDLHAAAARAGQFYPPDPTETGSSIGGNIACNASGSSSFRYGATGRWVQRLRVVLADGRILDLGRGEPIDFDPGTIPLPQRHQEHRRLPAASRAWTGSTCSPVARAPSG